MGLTQRRGDRREKKGNQKSDFVTSFYLLFIFPFSFFPLLPYYTFAPFG